MGANQNARKLLSTDLVNANTDYSSSKILHCLEVSSGYVRADRRAASETIC